MKTLDILRKKMGPFFYRSVGFGCVTAFFTMGLVLGLSQSVSGKEVVVRFADPELEAAVREAISKPVGDFLQSEVVQLVVLDASMGAIQKLDGIEYLTGLESLDLSYNKIVDISPLAELGRLKQLNLAFNLVVDCQTLSRLTKLTSLDLHRNLIQDISFLASLDSLEKLDLNHNQIKNISGLSRLTALWQLDLSFNKVEDISSVSHLISLRELYLGNNVITDISSLVTLNQLRVLKLRNNEVDDISALEGLIALEMVDLRGNQIRNLLALVHNESLGQGDEVDVGDNPLGSMTHTSQIPSLKLRGVRIWPSTFDRSSLGVPMHFSTLAGAGGEAIVNTRIAQSTFFPPVCCSKSI